jgi:hypothetical protein
MASLLEAALKAQTRLWAVKVKHLNTATWKNTCRICSDCQCPSSARLELKRKALTKAEQLSEAVFSELMKEFNGGGAPDVVGGGAPHLASSGALHVASGGASGSSSSCT